MDKETRFAILVIGIPFLGLAYCGLIFVVMIYWVWAREHPVTMATFFVLAPALISGSIWLLASYKARQKQRLGLSKIWVKTPSFYDGFKLKWKKR